MGIWYRTGTVTVANGSPSVTGILTGWTDATVRDVDALFVPASSSYPGEILTVNSATSITLAANWHGTNQTSVPYFIIRGTSWADVTRLAVQISELIEGRVEILGGVGAPSDSDGADGSVYFRSDVAEYYKKDAGTWGSPISLTGPAGPAGPSYSGTSTTSRTLGVGSMTFTTQAGLAYASGVRLRFTSAANPMTHYMEGVVTAYSTTTLTVTMDRFVGTGTRADWNISIVGDIGSTGPTGPGYAATSTASLAIGTGSKAFTGVGTSLGYTVGQRARASSAADTANYMEGRVTAYSGGTLTVTVDKVGGSGTFADWNINIAGDVGATGSQGPQGSTGNTGAAGASYAATSTTSFSVSVGSKVFTTQAGLAYVVGASRARASDSSGANYVEGLVTAYSATSLTISADRAVGSGTISSWNISLAGDVGAAGTNGTNGSVLATTSTTSLTPALGSKVFTVAAGLAFQTGQRVRGASAAAPTTNWFTGTVASYSSTTLTIAVDKLGSGPAAAADWNIAVSGEPGVDGAGSVISVNGYTGTIVLQAGDLGVAYSPSNYTPSSANPEGHFAGLDSALSASGTPSIAQGRLTGTSLTPITTSDVTAATTIYYTPHIGARVPIYNGTSFVMTTFAELSNVLANSATGNAGPAAAAANSNYDLFVWNDSGTVRLTRGPLWTSNTGRGTGAGTSELERVAGLRVNKQAITNGPAAQRGTYVGTIRTDASSQGVDAAHQRYMWNEFNRAARPLVKKFGADTWTYSTAAWRQSNGDSTYKVEIVQGADVDAVQVFHAAMCLNSTTTPRTVRAGVGLDSVTAFSGLTNGASATSSAVGSCLGTYIGLPGIGYHYFAGLEFGRGADAQTWYGDGGNSAIDQLGLMGSFMA